MQILIDISPRAWKQFELVQEMGAAPASSVSISGIYTETKRVQDAYRYVVRVQNGIARIDSLFKKGDLTGFFGPS